jgi:hypothetical protein
MTGYSELRKQLEEHPGWKIKMRREVHLRSVKIFGGNYTELASLIDNIEDPVIYYKDFSQKKCASYHSDIARLLFNYLSAAQSLVDHTRNYFKKWHSDDEVGEKYQEVVENTFVKDRASNMIKNLRNYLLHRGIPPSTIRESFNVETNGPPVINISFEVKTLSEWSKWSKYSKEYMQEKGDYVELRGLIKEYHDLVYSFYKWVDSILGDCYKEEQSEMLKLLEKVIKLEKQLHGVVIK